MNSCFLFQASNDTSSPSTTPLPSLAAVNSSNATRNETSLRLLPTSSNSSNNKDENLQSDSTGKSISEDNFSIRSKRKVRRHHKQHHNGTSENLAAVPFEHKRPVAFGTRLGGLRRKTKKLVTVKSIPKNVSHADFGSESQTIHVKVDPPSSYLSTAESYYEEDSKAAVKNTEFVRNQRNIGIIGSFGLTDLEMDGILITPNQRKSKSSSTRKGIGRGRTSSNSLSSFKNVDSDLSFPSHEKSLSGDEDVKPSFPRRTKSSNDRTNSASSVRSGSRGNAYGHYPKPSYRLVKDSDYQDSYSAWEASDQRDKGKETQHNKRASLDYLPPENPNSHSYGPMERDSLKGPGFNKGDSELNFQASNGRGSIGERDQGNTGYLPPTQDFSSSYGRRNDVNRQGEPQTQQRPGYGYTPPVSPALEILAQNGFLDLTTPFPTPPPTLPPTLSPTLPPTLPPSTQPFYDDGFTAGSYGQLIPDDFEDPEPLELNFDDFPNSFNNINVNNNNNNRAAFNPDSQGKLKRGKYGCTLLYTTDRIHQGVVNQILMGKPLMRQGLWCYG